MILLQLEHKQIRMADLNCASSFFASVVQGVLHDLVGLLLQQLLQGYAHPPCSIPTCSGLYFTSRVSQKPKQLLKRVCAPLPPPPTATTSLTQGFERAWLAAKTVCTRPTAAPAQTSHPFISTLKCSTSGSWAFLL